MKRILFFLFLLSLESLSAKILFEDNFDGPWKSPIYRKLKKKRLPVEIDDYGRLRVRYISNEMGSKRILTFLPLYKKVQAATLSFSVLFEGDFDFAKGGKLHGVGPKKSITGGESMTPSGWSSRIMFKKKGGVSTYVYNQNKKKKYGEDRRAKDFKFKRNEFYQVSLYTKLNTRPFHPDGEVHIYINGVPLVKHKGLIFWNSDEKAARISRFLFSTFHGGHSPSWAPRDGQGNFKDMYAIFDNFKIVEGLHFQNHGLNDN